MNAIVAVDSNWGIGYKNKLLLSIPEDMKYFRTMTDGKVVVVGLKTLKSFPGKQPLKNRTNIILAADRKYKNEKALVCHSLEELLALLDNYNTEDVFVIGGESVYRLLLPYCSKAYITKIEKEFKADRYFENLDEKEGWRLSDAGEQLEYNGINYRFTTYTNDLI